MTLGNAEREPVLQLTDADDVMPATDVQAPVLAAPAAKVKPGMIVKDDPDPMSHRLAWNHFLHDMKQKLASRRMTSCMRFNR